MTTNYDKIHLKWVIHDLEMTSLYKLRSNFTLGSYV